MDRHFRSLGLRPVEVSPLDRLAWLGTRTMGALTYHPETPREPADERLFDLHELGRHAQAIHSGAVETVLPQLLNAGGSPGGARPKVLVGWNQDSGALVSGDEELPAGFAAWIVKFTAQNDPPDAGATEHAYALMAEAAGVDLPPTRLFRTAEGDRFFGVQRFDRVGRRRVHAHTFGNLIQSNFRIPSADYADLLKVTATLTRNHQDVLRAYRRMVFNVLAHNRDDHVKNFAFLLDDASGEWTLSPAYDLVCSPGPGGEHTMTIAGEGRQPGRAHMLELAQRAGVSRADAQRTIEQVREATARWSEWASQAGVSGRGIDAVAAELARVAL